MGQGIGTWYCTPGQWYSLAWASVGFHLVLDMAGFLFCFPVPVYIFAPLRQWWSLEDSGGGLQLVCYWSAEFMLEVAALTCCPSKGFYL